jgi:hypothetical protein
MTVYITWAYYNDTYVGTVVPEAEFGNMARQASRLIDAMTYGRVAAIVEAATDLETIDKIQMAVCAVADEVYKDSISDGADGIQSERTGNYQVSFAANSSKAQTFERKANKAAVLYLWDTGLLFKGFNADER